MRIGDRVVLIVAAGTSRMDNKKVKAAFGGKPKMLGVDEVAEITGHEVGGVCPFGLKTPLPVYCDVSLKAFDIVVPAAGSTHSAVRIAPERMAELTAAEWVDVCQPPVGIRVTRVCHSPELTGDASTEQIGLDGFFYLAVNFSEVNFDAPFCSSLLRLPARCHAVSRGDRFRQCRRQAEVDDDEQQQPGFACSTATAPRKAISS